MNDRSRPKAAPETAAKQSGSSLAAGITADGITKLLNARCVDCNGDLVGNVEALDGFVLFLTRHAATCLMWGERARNHGVGRDDILVHTLGHLDRDENVFVYLGGPNDSVCHG